MTDQADQDPRDEWQTRLLEAAYSYSIAIRQLHETNPCPERPALDQAMNTLMTELWDRCFSQTEIRTAFDDAVADLPRYAAGEEVRS